MSPFKKIAAHLAVWVVYTTVATFVFGYQAGFKNAFAETLFSYLFAAGVFYSNVWLLNYSAGKRRYWLHVPFLLAIVLVNFSIKFYFFKTVFPLLYGRESSIAQSSTVYIFLIFFWQAFTFLIFSTGYWFARKQLRDQRAALEAEKVKSAFEKLELENAVLQAQIDPHFLGNTLGFIKEATSGTNPEVSEFTTALMTFMQSSIPVTDSSGKIMLEEELAPIESLIHIFQARFPNAVISYYKDVESGVRIVPHVLSPFIENAFKHGKLTTTDCAVNVSVQTEDDDLIFYVCNQKNDKFKGSVRRIGSKYVKRQLERSYKGKYKLNIDETDTEYRVLLMIQNIVTRDKNELHYG